MQPYLYKYSTMDDSEFRKKYPNGIVTNVYHGCVTVTHPITSKPKLQPPEE